VAKSKRPSTKKSLQQGFPKNAPKVLVYEALAGFNRNFEQVLLDLDRLATLDLFTERWQRRAFKACRATLEEMRAWANFELIEVLHQREEKEWVRFARIRKRAEKQSAPDDVLLTPQPNTGKSLRRKCLAKNVIDGQAPYFLWTVTTRDTVPVSPGLTFMISVRFFSPSWA